MTAVASTDALLEERLVGSLRLIRHHQHANGEILAYRRHADGSYAYRRSVLLTARVHDVLGCFDPFSADALDGALTMVAGPAQEAFARTVREVRRRIRGFLIWQEEAAGRWRFLGRGSGIDPDVATTAAACLALAEGHGAHSPAASRRRHEALLSFREPSGWFATFRRGDGRGYGWMDARGRPVNGIDRVANAEVLEHLAAGGRSHRPEARTLARLLADEILRPGGPSPTERSTLYLRAVTLPAALARAARCDATLLPDGAREAMRTRLLDLQAPAGDFGGPLSTAVAGTALLDLGAPEAPLARAKQAVLRGLGADGGWTYEDYLVQGVGSPAWTTAASLGFLGRYRHATGSLLS